MSSKNYFAAGQDISLHLSGFCFLQCQNQEEKQVTPAARSVLPLQNCGGWLVPSQARSFPSSKGPTMLTAACERRALGWSCVPWLREGGVRLFSEARGAERFLPLCQQGCTCVILTRTESYFNGQFHCQGVRISPLPIAFYRASLTVVLCLL